MKEIKIPTYEKVLAEYKKRGIKNPEESARQYLKGYASTDKGRSKLPLETKKKLFS